MRVAFLLGIVIAAGLVMVSAGAAHATPAQPTFAADVAPILYANCVSCHRTGEVAPFTLTSYDDARKRAKTIARVTGERFMPPWKPEAGHGDFKHVRRLTDEQVKTLSAWAEAGAPEGDAKQTPPLPKFPDGWQLGEPDLVVTMPETYTLRAEGRDDYRCFVLPLNLDADKFVSAVEFRPGNRKVVHHALFFLDTTGKARELDEKADGPGYAMMGGIGFLPTGSLGGWAPGYMPQRLPDGIARRVRKGSDLVLQTHFHPSGKIETERSTVGIYFAKKTPDKLLVSIPRAIRKLEIPAGEKDYRINHEGTLPLEVELIGITPHAHLLCKEIKVDATLPDGTPKPLIWIKDWDFNWQGQYRYAAPVHLPKGTRVQMRYVYDNSDGNPRNPASPPKLVTWGEETNDEMAIAFLEFVLPSPADVPAFRTSAMLQTLDSFLAAGGGIDDLPPGVAGGAAQRLRQAFQLFDRNRDGRLDDPERTALMEVVRGLVAEP